MLVSFNLHPSSQTYSWDFAGGCFENGDYALYERATPGLTYNFDNVQIEIRQANKNDALAKAQMMFESYSGVLSAAFLILAGVLGGYVGY